MKVVILYEGLKYNPNLNELGSWKNEYTVFLETELLFSFNGLNGEIFQKQFNDFHKYVNEINNASRKKKRQ